MLEAFIDESAPGRSTMLYYLSGDDGVRQLHFVSASPPRPGTRLSVTGVTVGDGFYVDGYDVVSRAASSDAEPVLGEQPTIVLLLNYLDDLSEWLTPSEVGELVFDESDPDSVTGRLLELSYGKTWLAGDVTDWITLPINKSDCSAYLRPYSSIFQNTVDFVDPMVDFSLYRRVLVVSKVCGGVASYGDISVDTDEGQVQVSVALGPVSRTYTPQTLIHELGHCFELTHPGGLECGDLVVGDFLDGCDYVYRGDRYDLMARNAGHFNASAKDRLGWFDPKNIAQLGTGTHEIALYPLELPTDQVQMIKVPASYDAFGNGELASYVIEYRRPIGIDDGFPELQDPAVGVLLRLIEDEYWLGSQLLDMTPHKTSEEYSQIDDSAESHLLLGVPFVDARHGITITLDSVTEDTAIVIVDIPRICDNGTCDPGEGPCDCPADCGQPVAVDCTGNGVADECEPDCNGNGIADSCDIAGVVSNDCPGGTGNGIPDECEVFADCNANAVTDACDIDAGVSIDLNANGIPDECEPHTTVYVDLANCPGPGTGSAGDPFCRIQDAIDDQPLDAGLNEVVEIIVADGTYTGEGNTDLRYGGRSCTLRSANGPQNCIIDMQGVGRGVTFDGEESAGARLEGFTITGGTGGDPGSGYADGGGILCAAWASPTIINCTVTGNTADSLGGGIHIDKWARPTIADCRITNNYLTHDTVEKHGAGISCNGASPLIRDCLITDNHVLGLGGVRRGGGIGLWMEGHPTIIRCVIARNTAGQQGGGISAQIGSYLVILDTLIEDNALDGSNTSAAQGGGLAVMRGGAILRGCRITGNTTGGGLYLYKSELVMHECTIAGNSTDSVGGGIKVDTGITELRSCLITGNSSQNSGGGLACTSLLGAVGTLLLESCTITGNAAGGPGGGVSVTWAHAVVDNCIVRDNTSDAGSALALVDSVGAGSTMEVRYSNIDGGQPGAYVSGKADLVWGEGNVDLDPLFRDPDGPDNDATTWQDNDYHLTHYSPSVDGGNPYLLPLLSAKDIDNEPRVMGCQLDMGADELWAGCASGRVGRSGRPTRGTFGDCNSNCVPDECEIDCQPNGVPDDCDIRDVNSTDVNANEIPDECEDCNASTLPDECDVDCSAAGGLCNIVGCGLSNDCNEDFIPDDCQLINNDCNNDLIPDECQLVENDCDTNGTPDECQPDEDCNGNAIQDICDIADRISADCNSNQVPDECDIATGTSADENGNAVPDDCEVLKNRYISLLTSDETQPLAYRVDMIASEYFPASTGPLGWVDEPDVNDVSRVVDDPLYLTDWPTLVYVGDCEIVPVATYEIWATADGAAFTNPREIPTIHKPGTRYYGDVAGTGTGNLPPLLGFTAPNGVVNVADVQAYILTAQGASTPSAPVTWFDLHGLGDGSPPNFILNISDLQRIKFGFQGLQYTDTPAQLDPADCP